MANDGRVDDGVQFADSRGSGWIRTEGGFREFRAVDAAVGIQDGATEVAYDFVIDGLAGLHEFVGNVVGLDEVRARATSISPTIDLPLAIPPVKPTFSRGASRGRKKPFTTEGTEIHRGALGRTAIEI